MTISAWKWKFEKFSEFSLTFIDADFVLTTFNFGKIAGETSPVGEIGTLSDIVIQIWIAVELTGNSVG